MGGDAYKQRAQRLGFVAVFGLEPAEVVTTQK